MPDGGIERKKIPEMNRRGPLTSGESVRIPTRLLMAKKHELSEFETSMTANTRRVKHSVSEYSCYQKSRRHDPISSSLPWSSLGGTIGRELAFQTQYDQSQTSNLPSPYQTMILHLSWWTGFFSGSFFVLNFCRDSSALQTLRGTNISDLLLELLEKGLIYYTAPSRLLYSQKSKTNKTLLQFQRWCFLGTTCLSWWTSKAYMRLIFLCKKL